jgi:hypothetical protein
MDKNQIIKKIKALNKQNKIMRGKKTSKEIISLKLDLYKIEISLQMKSHISEHVNN